MIAVCLLQSFLHELSHQCFSSAWFLILPFSGSGSALLIAIHMFCGEISLSSIQLFPPDHWHFILAIHRWISAWSPPRWGWCHRFSRIDLPSSNPIGSMYAINVTYTINIPQMLAYIPYMDPMGMNCFKGRPNSRIFPMEKLPWLFPLLDHGAERNPESQVPLKARREAACAVGEHPEPRGCGWR